MYLLRKVKKMETSNVKAVLLYLIHNNICNSQKTFLKRHSYCKLYKRGKSEYIYVS